MEEEESEHSATSYIPYFHEFFSTSLPPRTQYSPQINSGGSSSTPLQNPSDHFYHNHVLEKYATKKCTKVTLRQLEVYARTMTNEKLLRSANFLKEEITIRFAHRICQFQALPYIVTSHPAFQRIYQGYWNTFTAFRRFPRVDDAAMNVSFCTLVQHALHQHRSTLPLLIAAMAQVSSSTSSAATAAGTALTPFLKQTIASQLGCRVLAYHHLAMTLGGHSRMVSQRMCVMPLLRAYPTAILESRPTENMVLVTGVPELLRFIFASFLAPVPHGVRITVCDSPRTVLVRLSDTHADANRCAFSFQPRSNMELRRALSKVCLEYFGGELQCVAMEGYGTDVYISLDKEGNVPEALEEER